MQKLKNLLNNMKTKTKSSNIYHHRLIRILWKSKRRIWREAVRWLKKPKSQQIVINIKRINQVTKENDIIIVPGKVLGHGDFNHKINSIAALSFSESAKNKIINNKSIVESIEELYKRNPEGKNVKIII